MQFGSDGARRTRSVWLMDRLAKLRTRIAVDVQPIDLTGGIAIGLLVLGLAIGLPDMNLASLLLSLAAVFAFISLRRKGNVRGGALADGGIAKLEAVSRRIDKRIEHLEDSRWQVRDNAERLRELLDAQDDLIARHDGQGRLIFANRAFRAAFGERCHDVLARVLTANTQLKSSAGGDAQPLVPPISHGASLTPRLP